MKTFEVTLVVDVPVIWKMQIQAETVEQAEAIALGDPWADKGPSVVKTGWDGWAHPHLPGLQFDLESTRTVELVPEQATVEVEAA